MVQNPENDALQKRNKSQESVAVFCANFFDTENPAKSVLLPENTAVDFQVGTEKYTGEISGSRDHCQKVTMPGGKDHNELLKLIGEEGVYADILPTTFKIGCATYLTRKVQFLLKNDSAACCCVQVPTSKESEGCSIHFGALRRDAGKIVAMEEEVIWKVKEIQTSPGAHASGKVRMGQTVSPFTATVTSVNGFAELFDLPLERLYQFEVQAPEGWRCPEPVFYRYVCCDTEVEIVNNFESCDCKPTRTLVFVEKGCQGVRWSPGGDGTGVSLGGVPLVIKEGMASVSPDIKSGTLTFNYPGKAFDPPFVELGGDGPAVTAITVADQPAIKTPRVVQGQLVADDKTPFARRKIHCKLPNKEEIQLVTDEHGCFTCEEGSLVRAEEDEYGFAIEPFLLTEIE